MKNHKKYIAALTLVIGVTMSSPVSANVEIKLGDKIENTQDVVIPEAELPSAIKKYIKKHFSDYKVIKVEKDKSLTGHTYEVKLDKGVELDFNENNEITDIDGTMKLPDSAIPKSILKYVEKNYPENVITDWELNKTNQEVKLDSGIELEFSLKGEFVRIDQ